MSTTVERLERAIAVARQRGFEVRFEALQGAVGGVCEFGSKRWIFIEITSSVQEQLDQLLASLNAAVPTTKVA